MRPLLALLLMAATELAAATPAPASPPPVVRSPRPGSQLRAFLSKAPELCYSGRRFGGKSHLGCLKGLAYAVKYPGARVGICREERASMETSTLKTLRSEIFTREQWAAWWRESKSMVELPNGSEMHVFGLDKPGRALGSRFGYVFVDQAEQLSYEQFQVIESCLMQAGMPWHQLLLAFNPEGPDHWAFERYRPDDGDGVRRHRSGQVFAEVVHVQPDEFLEYLTPLARERFDRMDGVLGQRLRWGKWVAAEGAVFETWDAAVHVLDAASPPEWAAADMELWGRWNGFPPPDWVRRRGIDFGYEPDPYCCVWVAESPQGRRYVYRYDLHTRLTIEEQAARIHQHEAEELEALRSAACEQGEDVVRGVADYLDEFLLQGSWSDHARGEREMLAARGIATAPAEKDIRAGIETLRELLDHREGAPRLVILSDALVERDSRLVEQRRPSSGPEEMPRYRWRTVREKGDANSTRDLPVDRHNHFIDALRYCEHSNALGVRLGVWM